MKLSPLTPDPPEFMVAMLMEADDVLVLAPVSMEINPPVNSWALPPKALMRPPASSPFIFPTVSFTVPVEPWLLSPLENKRSPELPLLDVPEAKIKPPLTPTSPALDVCITKDPDDEELE